MTIQPFQQKTPNYSLGTASIANGSTAVTFTGANLVGTDGTTGIVSTTVCVGDRFNVPGVGSGTIQAIDSGGEAVTLAEPWSAASQTNVAYTIYRYSTPLQGVALAAANSLLTQGSDANPDLSRTIDDGTARLKLRLKSGAASIAVGPASTADASLVEGLDISTAGVVSAPNGFQFAQPKARNNRLINGNFDIWQRGTSFTVAPANGPYLADRWVAWNNSGQNVSVSKVAAPTGFRGQNAFNVQITGAAANSSLLLYQRMESQMCADMDGQACMLSLDLNASASAGSMSFVYAISTNTALDNGTFSNNVIFAGVSISAGYNLIKIPLTAAQTAGLKYGGEIMIYACSNAVANLNITYGSVQFELGTVAQPFEKYALGAELALCQRYYEHCGFLCLSTLTYGSTNWAVPKRVSPTITVTPGSGSGVVVVPNTGVLQTSGFYQSVANSALVYGDVYGNAEL